MAISTGSGENDCMYMYKRFPYNTRNGTLSFVGERYVSHLEFAKSLCLRGRGTINLFLPFSLKLTHSKIANNHRSNRAATIVRLLPRELPPARRATQLK